MQVISSPLLSVASDSYRWTSRMVCWPTKTEIVSMTSLLWKWCVPYVPKPFPHQWRCHSIEHVHTSDLENIVSMFICIYKYTLYKYMYSRLRIIRLRIIRLSGLSDLNHLAPAHALSSTCVQLRIIRLRFIRLSGLSDLFRSVPLKKIRVIYSVLSDLCKLK